MSIIYTAYLTEKHRYKLYIVIDRNGEDIELDIYCTQGEHASQYITAATARPIYLRLIQQNMCIHAQSRNHVKYTKGLESH